MENKSKNRTGVIHLAGFLSWLPWEETWYSAVVACVCPLPRRGDPRPRDQDQAGSSGGGGLLS